MSHCNLTIRFNENDNSTHYDWVWDFEPAENADMIAEQHELLLGGDQNPSIDDEIAILEKYGHTVTKIFA